MHILYYYLCVHICNCTRVHLRLFLGGVRVAQLFSFLCCGFCLVWLCFMMFVSMECPLWIATPVIANVYCTVQMYWYIQYSITCVHVFAVIRLWCIQFQLYAIYILPYIVCYHKHK